MQWKSSLESILPAFPGENCQGLELLSQCCLLMKFLAHLMLTVPSRENIVNPAGSARNKAHRLGRRLFLLEFVGSWGEVLLPIPQG